MTVCMPATHSLSDAWSILVAGMLRPSIGLWRSFFHRPRTLGTCSICNQIASNMSPRWVACAACCWRAYGPHVQPTDACAPAPATAPRCQDIAPTNGLERLYAVLAAWHFVLLTIYIYIYMYIYIYTYTYTYAYIYTYICIYKNVLIHPYVYIFIYYSYIRYILVTFVLYSAISIYP